jgi:hypothetical protein
VSFASGSIHSSLNFVEMMCSDSSGDVPEVLEERGVVGVVLAVVVRAGVGHREVHELQALAVSGLLDLALRALDGADDGLDVRIECSGGAGGEHGGDENKQRLFHMGEKRN